MAPLLEEYCGSEFWNSSLSWNTDDPDLTVCFQKTVLVWTPCLFLWVFASLDVFYMLNSKQTNIPWNWLNASKFLITAALIVLMVVDFAVALWMKDGEERVTPNVDIYNPILKILTFILCEVILFYNKKFGVRSSGLHFLFWMLLTVCAIPQLRTEIRLAQNKESKLTYLSISYLIFFPLAVFMLILNLFADKAPKYSEHPKITNPCPEDASGFLSRMFFSWYDPLAWKGYRKPLQKSDLWKMNPEDTAQEVLPLFEKHWQKAVKKCEGFTSEFKATSYEEGAKGSRKNTASVFLPMLKAFKPSFTFAAFLKLCQDLLTFVSPQILKLLIGFVEESEPQWRGYFYAVLLFVTSTLQTILLSQYYKKVYVVGMRVRTVLLSSIYRKSLRMSTLARKETTVGEIVNLMSVDVEKLVEITAYLHMFWSAPLQIILALYFLWQVLGPSVLAGLAILIILIPINACIANKIKKLQFKQMKYKDQRTKTMNEVLTGIKILKLYAWEPSFESQIMKIRSKEMDNLKTSAYLKSGMSFLWACAPFMVSLVTFATYVLVDDKNVLNASTAFVSLSLFNTLRMPLGMLPLLSSSVVQAGVSLKRINNFMNCKELNPESVTHDPSETSPLVIENATFAWDEGAVLKRISLRFNVSSLTAVVGSVGSGKSSLLSALLGEMEKTSGRVNTIGSVAYVSQQAWIQNATLRDNILFGQAYVKKRYEQVVEACALTPDFGTLPAGDLTEIGEKGINLSGGQKQRVSLARAVYKNADNYLLDDPLSAVDAHVGKHIFERVIGPNGLLKSKTRVLVTHGITYLPQVDKIVVLKDGEVSDVGTYNQLLEKEGSFAEFLREHIKEAEEEVLEGGTTKEISWSPETGGEIKPVDGAIKPEGGGDSPFGVEMKKLSKDKLIEEEKVESGGVKWVVYKHYLQSIGYFMCFLSLALKMVFQGFGIGSNIWLSKWSDDGEIVVDGVTDAKKQNLYLGVYGALGFGQAASIFAGTLVIFFSTLNAAHILHDYLLGNVLRAPSPTFFDVTPVGRILNRFSKDVDTLDNVLPMILREWTTYFFAVLGTLFVVSFTTPIFAAAIVPIILLYYFIQRFYIASSRQSKRLESITRSPIYSHFGETVSGAHAIRAFSEQPRFIRESEGNVDDYQDAYWVTLVANRWLAVRLEMLGNLIVLLAAIFAVIDRDQNPGLVGLSISYALEITPYLNGLVRMTSDTEANIVSVERIKEYAATPQEAPWEVPNNQPPKYWPDRGVVSFKECSVRYRDGLDLVLKNVSFTTEGGEKIGIVGRTGAGKSSLTLALFRIIEAAEGDISIDDVKISGMGLHALRSRLTIIPQDAVLFSGTLRMNLDPFEEHSDGDIWAALEHAHLKSFVKGLPSGLAHEVAEGGENLSVGQRQLVCLGRALLRKTKVLILDEATAAVDLETDNLIQKTIRQQFKDCTILTIAHRLNTIMDSDRIIVLDKGQMVEFDTPQRLLQKKDSIFHGMCRDAGLV